MREQGTPCGGSIPPSVLIQNLSHMDMLPIHRLEYIEETFAGETETWYDPATDTYYHIPITIKRDWENAEKIVI